VGKPDASLDPMFKRYASQRQLPYNNFMQLWIKGQFHDVDEALTI
jgi:hypothetical protein